MATTSTSERKITSRAFLPGRGQVVMTESLRKLGMQKHVDGHALTP